MTMTNLRSFLDDYEARNPGFRERSRAASEAFWASYCVPGGSGHVKPEGWKLRG